jgi:hypothetical protein
MSPGDTALFFAGPFVLECVRLRSLRLAAVEPLTASFLSGLGASPIACSLRELHVTNAACDTIVEWLVTPTASASYSSSSSSEDRNLALPALECLTLNESRPVRASGTVSTRRKGITGPNLKRLTDKLRELSLTCPQLLYAAIIEWPAVAAAATSEGAALTAATKVPATTTTANSHYLQQRSLQSLSITVTDAMPLDTITDAWLGDGANDGNGCISGITTLKLASARLIEPTMLLSFHACHTLTLSDCSLTAPVVAALFRRLPQLRRATLFRCRRETRRFAIAPNVPLFDPETFRREWEAYPQTGAGLRTLLVVFDDDDRDLRHPVALAVLARAVGPTLREIDLALPSSMSPADLHAAVTDPRTGASRFRKLRRANVLIADDPAATTQPELFRDILMCRG